MYKDTFQYLDELVSAVSADDFESMIDASSNVEVTGRHEKWSNAQLDTLLDTLLACLDHYRFSETMGGWHIFNVILSYAQHSSEQLIAEMHAFVNKHYGIVSDQSTHFLVAEQFSELQIIKIYDYLDNHYGDFINQSTCFLMAEWYGGCRNERALTFIEKWISPDTSDVPLVNLKIALLEFSEMPLPYVAEAALLEKAKELKVKLNVLLEQRKLEPLT